jgi:hypothetical protein
MGDHSISPADVGQQRREKVHAARLRLSAGLASVTAATAKLGLAIDTAAERAHALALRMGRR